MRPFALLFLVACSRNQKSDTEGPVLAGDSGDVAIDTAPDLDTGPVEDDADGDGYTESGGDCDDTDATVHPGATEICDDRDNDCDGVSDADLDSDADGISDCDDYCPYYVEVGGTGDGRMVDPMGSVQAAIDAAGASGCNEVRVYYGTYTENLDWGGYPVNVESIAGPEVTVLDGGGAGPVASFQSGEDESARLYGFTVTNGAAAEGAGIYVFESSPTIEGNRIVGNATDAYPHVGGGIRVKNGSPVIVDNEITGNDAGYGLDEDGSDGGAINVRGGAPWIEGNVLAGNSAGDGGAIWIAYADATILNNLIAGNIAEDVDPEAGGQGGGINVQIGGAAGTWVVANLIVDNAAGMFGGGLVTYEANDSYPVTLVENNTIAWNTVYDTDYGAGFCQWRRTEPTVLNNIVAFNRGVGVYSEDGIDDRFTYNLVWGNVTDYVGLAGSGVGNLGGDPRFTAWTDNGDWTDDDFRLGAGSPAIDAGDPSILDPDGTRSDMGAYGGVGGGW